MIQPLNFHDVMKLASMCGLAEPVTVIDVRSGRMYERCVLDVDPDTEHAFVYTDDGAYFDFDYGLTWWAYLVVPTKYDIPDWDIT